MASTSKKKRMAKEIDHGDSLTILEAVIDFQSQHGGANPTPTNMKPLFDSVADTLHSDLTLDQLYNRIRHLRQKYYRILNSSRGHVTTASLAEKAFFDLSSKAWGPKKPANGSAVAAADVDEEGKMDDDVDEEEVDSLRWVEHEAREYWKVMKLEESVLEMGISLVDRAKGRILEKKWVQHGEAGMKIMARTCELEKELFLALGSAMKENGRQ